MIDNIPRVHLIEVKYLGTTDTKGARVKATSLRFGDSVTFSYDYEFDNVAEMFLKWLKNLDNDLGYTSLGYDEKNGVYIFGVKAFEPMGNIKKGEVLA